MLGREAAGNFARTKLNQAPCGVNPPAIAANITTITPIR